MDEKKIIISKNGPYIVSENIPLKKEILKTDKDGFPIKWEDGEKFKVSGDYALCRCGMSRDKPYCDSTHIKIKFDGTETASRRKYLEEAEIIDGKNIKLTDVFHLCNGAGFCNGREGNTWDLTLDSSKKANDIAIRQACDCPSGRLVIWDKKTNKAIEPKFDASIGLIEEPRKKVSGALFIKGDILIESSDGFKYEKRNRVNLCRCGKSTNKPYCDGAHKMIGFNAEKK